MIVTIEIDLVVNIVIHWIRLSSQQSPFHRKKMKMGNELTDRCCITVKYFMDTVTKNNDVHQYFTVNAIQANKG